jgi:hypothetical protein
MVTSTAIEEQTLSAINLESCASRICLVNLYGLLVIKVIFDVSVNHMKAGIFFIMYWFPSSFQPEIALFNK